MRFLFSMVRLRPAACAPASLHYPLCVLPQERNRKAFKRLFPPDLFAAFIDIGHYNASLSAYTGLVQRLEGAVRAWLHLPCPAWPCPTLLGAAA